MDTQLAGKKMEENPRGSTPPASTKGRRLKCLPGKDLENLDCGATNTRNNCGTEFRANSRKLRAGRRGRMPEFPYKIKVGRQEATIYQPNSGTQWRATFYEGKSRRHTTANSFEECKAKVTERLKALNNAVPFVAALSPHETEEYRRAEKIAKTFGETPSAALSEWRDARNLIPEGKTLLEVIRDYNAQFGALKPIRVATALEEYHAQRTCSEEHKAKEFQRLKKFTAAFQCDLLTITKDSLQQWLTTLDVGAKTRNHYGNAVRGFFKYCVQRDYLPKNHRLGEALSPSKTNPTDPGILTPNEFFRFFEKLDERLKGRVALVSHGGLRLAEAWRIEPESIRNGHISVGATIAKTQHRRTIPIQPWLQSALEAYPIHALTLEESTIQKRIRHAFRDAGVPNPPNCLRHSFCSYRYALADENTVAKEAGNSPEIMKRNYKAVVSEDDARRWFGVRKIDGCELLRG